MEKCIKGVVWPPKWFLKLIYSVSMGRSNSMLGPNKTILSHLPGLMFPPKLEYLCEETYSVLGIFQSAGLYYCSWPLYSSVWLNIFQHFITAVVWILLRESGVCYISLLMKTFTFGLQWLLFREISVSIPLISTVPLLSSWLITTSAGVINANSSGLELALGFCGLSLPLPEYLLYLEPPHGRLTQYL